MRRCRMGKFSRLATFLAIPVGVLVLHRLFTETPAGPTTPAANATGLFRAEDRLAKSANKEPEPAVLLEAEPESEPGTALQKEARIFVYSLPPELEAQVVGDDRNNWMDYKADLWVRSLMQASLRRTTDPEEADLFFIPALPTRWFHARFNDMSFEQAAASSADYVRRTIEHVSQEWPYWNRTRGRDHFMTLTHDKGRCTHLVGLNRTVVGDMFVLQHHGDLWAHIGEGKAYDFSCYEPDRDILLPGFMPSSHVGIVSPFDDERPISVLYRFRGDDTKDPFHGVPVRNKLWEHYQSDPPPGADWQVRSTADTLDDMAKSVFCVTPPGWVGYTGRFWRAIQRGCIPISFYRAYDLAFQGELEYAQFTVNLQPNHVQDLSRVVRRLLADPSRVQQMQVALEEAQQQLSWDTTEQPTGVERLLYDALDYRAAAIADLMHEAAL